MSPVILAGLSCLCAQSPVSPPMSETVTPARLAARGVLSNVRAAPGGPVELNPGLSCGTCRMTVDVPDEHPKRVMVKLLNAETPAGDGRSRLWPALATDIITQVRFCLANGTWTGWRPGNLLTGGDMADSDADGIPDWVSVMRLRESGNFVCADTCRSDWMPPDGDYWQGKTRGRGRFLDRVERPPGAGQSLKLTRATSDGQDTAAMRLDLAPPDTELTVCGWTRYDLGEETSMGVMARFHEFGMDGNRINKYVLLGDDDFRQPYGRGEWRWRALSFRSLAETTFLNIYPIRMTTARGRAWAANYELRLGAVYSDWGSRRAVFRESFEDLDRWDVAGPGAGSPSDKAVVGRSSLRLDPEPLKVVTATQKGYIDVEPGRLYAFRIAMQNDVPEHYEETHQAWVSAYLEFYDAEKLFLDCCKVMAFRPILEKPVGAAMHAPEGARYARFMLAASHISYGDRTGMDGPMYAYFDALQLERSEFDPAFTARPDGDVSAGIPAGAEMLEVRSFLLSRERHLTPSFGGFEIAWR